ncbi:hypothetical protein [Microbulbifer agarilyticus]|uniref:hypothetical protein n=1 Tax=Microbulbifer agarilyticus TaxID=260552 RepID=UPI001C95BF80|nr:hypothetical protein [Microbulbifer agarilyticus]MBY6191133.1 hypothetical protein [Microbulbifer agarilyticus]MBY6211732.1 hypothetical protein [Microbulbifer agarilyticus]MCA0893243.1 hypothetical protein [Microbulbifer agarilyticus]MCA0900320.1 hypothetical protein [Microbulbifer agarilyticus]
MNLCPRHKTPVWVSLCLLFALMLAQPVAAEHIHIEDRAHQLCDLSNNHAPALGGSDLTFVSDDLAPLYIEQQAPAARDCQPERQSARGPPAILSLS